MVLYFLLIFLHAAGRKRSIKSKMSTFMDRVTGKDVGTGLENIITDQLEETQTVTTTQFLSSHLKLGHTENESGRTKNTKRTIQFTCRSNERKVPFE